jgi:hypothetical protein
MSVDNSTSNLDGLLRTPIPSICQILQCLEPDSRVFVSQQSGPKINLAVMRQYLRGRNCLDSEAL